MQNDLSQQIRNPHHHTRLLRDNYNNYRRRVRRTRRIAWVGLLSGISVEGLSIGITSAEVTTSQFGPRHLASVAVFIAILCILVWSLWSLFYLFTYEE